MSTPLDASYLNPDREHLSPDVVRLLARYLPTQADPFMVVPRGHPPIVSSFHEAMFRKSKFADVKDVCGRSIRTDCRAPGNFYFYMQFAVCTAARGWKLSIRFPDTVRLTLAQPIPGWDTSSLRASKTWQLRGGKTLAVDCARRKLKRTETQHAPEAFFEFLNDFSCFPEHETMRRNDFAGAAVAEALGTELVRDAESVATAATQQQIDRACLDQQLVAFNRKWHRIIFAPMYDYHHDDDE